MSDPWVASLGFFLSVAMVKYLFSLINAPANSCNQIRGSSRACHQFTNIPQGTLSPFLMIVMIAPIQIVCLMFWAHPSSHCLSETLSVEYNNPPSSLCISDEETASQGD